MTILELPEIHKRYGGLVAVDEFDMTAEGGRSSASSDPMGQERRRYSYGSRVLSARFGPNSLSGKGFGRAEALPDLRLGHRPHLPGCPTLHRYYDVRKCDGGGLCRVRSTRGDRRKNLEVLQLVDFVDRGDVMVHELTTADHKRLELARALTTEPKLLLMDEPMAGLNPTKTTTCWNFCETSAAGGHSFRCGTRHEGSDEPL